VRSGPPNGFGRAVACGLNNMSGDAVVIMMAETSRYWNALNDG
jgi:dolichol-phosphate mannosyltransferase